MKNKVKILILSTILATFLVSCASKLKPLNKKQESAIKKKPAPIASENFYPADSKKVDPEEINKFCKKIDRRFKKYGWKKSWCKKYKWESRFKSVTGDPLLMTVFGDRRAFNSGKADVTLIFCGVHGDEITPIKFCFDVLEHMKGLITNHKHPANLHLNEDHSLTGKAIVVAPIVNPDSFFKRRPTRTNARGVDINRNFPTRDFKKDALRIWKKRYRRDKRRYPGKVASSEPEVSFQVDLIKKYRPVKIISVHAPLSMLDYDGPADQHTGGIIGSRANQLLIKMSKHAKGYRIKNYPFFPGSLGNYAGNERNIPTYTLELPTSDNRKSRQYWKLFKDAIHSAIIHSMEHDRDLAFKETVTD